MTSRRWRDRERARRSAAYAALAAALKDPEESRFGGGATSGVGGAVAIRGGVSTGGTGGNVRIRGGGGAGGRGGTSTGGAGGTGARGEVTVIVLAP